MQLLFEERILILNFIIFSHMKALKMNYTSFSIRNHYIRLEIPLLWYPIRQTIHQIWRHICTVLTDCRYNLQTIHIFNMVIKRKTNISLIRVQFLQSDLSMKTKKWLNLFPNQFTFTMVQVQIYDIIIFYSIKYKNLQPSRYF